MGTRFVDARVIRDRMEAKDRRLEREQATPPPDQLTVTVTLADLDAALAVSTRTRSQRCLVARALERTTGAKSASVGVTFAHVAGRVFSMPGDVRELVHLFDTEQYAALRAKLQQPQVFTFEVR